MPIPSSELITNADGSIYHLHLRPEDIAHDIITVGDTNRVDLVSRHLDKIDLTVQNREFKTVTGVKNGKRITIISTGIGTDNIDIVFNELDCLVNVDFDRREVKSNLTKLNFYRIGTSGTIRDDIAINQLLISAAAVDMGNLSQYYTYNMEGFALDISTRLSSLSSLMVNKNVVSSHLPLVAHINQGKEMIEGITITAPGFYAPQGRRIRLQSNMVDFKQLAILNIQGYQVTNLEMETAGIYLLAHLMGHKAVSTNAILANRLTGEFSTKPQKTIESLIELVVSRIVS